MQTPPSTISPIVNTRPPSSTRNSATAIAGIAARTRAERSERSRRCRLRRERAARSRPRSLRAACVRASPAPPAGRDRLGRDPRLRLPAGVEGPLLGSAISEASPATEAPAARRVLGQRLFERLAAEVRPQLL